MAAQFRLSRQTGGRFYFTLVSARGEELLKSRTYAKICTAESAIELVRNAAARSDRATVEDGRRGRFRVAIRAKTGGLLAAGPDLNAKGPAAAALTSVRRAAVSAEMIDARKK